MRVGVILFHSINAFSESQGGGTIFLAAAGVVGSGGVLRLDFVPLRASMMDDSGRRDIGGTPKVC